MPTDELLDQLRDQDQAVLARIQNGENDVQRIKAATTLSKRQVNYAFEKLENLGLIEVYRTDGQVERIIEGQKRVFDAPKEATLTQPGVHCLRSSDRDIEQYTNLSRKKLIEKIHNLEDRVTQIENGFEAFRQQVLQRLE